jgi:putative MFS transporter
VTADDGSAETTPDARRRDGMFWLGVLMATAGVLLHLPMYIQARDTHFVLAGMGLDPGMVAGMGLIVLGLAATAYGLLPRHAAREAVTRLRVRALDDAAIGWVHVRLLVVMAIAVTIDVMKPTTLAFVVPGVAVEYGLRSPNHPAGPLPVALLPLAGIAGTVLGSLSWGWLGDRIGRRASMLLAGAIFTATAICGAMPSFELNLLMCFVMGLGVGGMLPIAFTLLSETIPARHRGWLMVLIGGDIAGAYVITSWLSAALGPTFGWRILWLIGLPTGLLLVLLTRWIPESPRYLLAVGREAEARAVLREYRATIVPADRSELEVEAGVESSFGQLLRRPFLGLTAVMALLGLGIGLVLYGFQLWLPSNLRHLGLTGVSADTILRDSALLGFPLNFAVAYLYHRSTRWTMIGLSAVLAAALAGFVGLGDHVADNRTLLFALLAVPIWGSSSVAAVLTAYSAEVYPTRVRSRGSGLVAGLTKAGGVLVIALAAAAVAAPSIATTALLGAVPMALAAIVGLFVLLETRGRRLEEITAEELRQAARSAT